MDGPSHVAPVTSSVGSGDLAVALGCWGGGGSWVLPGAAGMLVLSNKQASAALSSDVHIFYKH